jgi:hypothetical protein
MNQGVSLRMAMVFGMLECTRKHRPATSDQRRPAIAIGDQWIEDWSVPAITLASMSRAFVDDDRDESGKPRRDFGLPPRDDPGYEAAAAKVLLEAAREGVTGEAEQATGFYWGDEALRAHVEALRKRAAKDGDERLQQLAERFLK